MFHTCTAVHTRNIIIIIIVLLLFTGREFRRRRLDAVTK